MELDFYTDSEDILIVGGHVEQKKVLKSNTEAELTQTNVVLSVPSSTTRPPFSDSVKQDASSDRLYECNIHYGVSNGVVLFASIVLAQENCDITYSLNEAYVDLADENFFSMPFAGGMKICLQHKDVAQRCKELGISALHIKIRATGGNKTKTPCPCAQSSLRALARSGMKIGRIGKLYC
ncbi:hypothetical protein IEQ34_001002 [Dendrobium chrysotoxum]|uniref:Uncharacterized protein n=1 Tax=Dendrobium chrysotoxum TaxID=161865 RepID=A0AAV7HNU5_DENCH|nr:hypothetical protein IEQ34_001002 [Dendrobium chrysotoxum]